MEGELQQTAGAFSEIQQADSTNLSALVCKLIAAHSE